VLRVNVEQLKDYSVTTIMTVGEIGLVRRRLGRKRENVQDLMAALS